MNAYRAAVAFFGVLAFSFSGKFDTLDWVVYWSSEHPVYGGHGTPEVCPDGCWFVSAESAVVLGPGPLRPRRPLPLIRRTA